jgi:sec-independent protein translocase protein TatA
MGEFSPWHMLIVAVVFVVLFGSRKLPEAARSLGRSLRIFKSEVRGLHDDATPTVTAQANPPSAAVTGSGISTGEARTVGADEPASATVPGGPQAG